MLTRRKFMIASSVIGGAFAVQVYSTETSLVVLKKRLDMVLGTIVSVQLHMFPPASLGFSFSIQALENFLRHTLFVAQYDPDIRLFVIEGAAQLMAMEKERFVVMDWHKKEQLLRQYEKTNYGSAWLSRILTLTMEALFSDPIYGVNRDEKMWQVLESYGGYPRPKSEYMKNV